MANMYTTVLVCEGALESFDTDEFLEAYGGGNNWSEITSDQSGDTKPCWTYDTKVLNVGGEMQMVVIAFTSSWRQPRLLPQIIEALRNRYGFCSVIAIGADSRDDFLGIIGS